MPPFFDLGITWGELSTFASVVVIDVVLAGDNAVVVGMAASGLESRRRHRVIFWGVLAATVLRIVLAAVAVQLLAVIGLTLAGGILLLWVAWKFYRDLVMAPDSAAAVVPQSARFSQAFLRIVLADLSMSLDNVLAVAGTARHHLWVLISGLVLSVALMGVASDVIARLLDRFHWIAWVGLAIVTFVALRMIYDGWEEVATRFSLVLGLSRNWVL